MSDKTFAEMLSVSEKTVSRALTTLEGRGFITRKTMNVRGGRERHIIAVLNAIHEALTTDNLTVDDASTDKMTFAQRTNCPLHNGQNDLIKENKEKEKRENSGLRSPSPSAQASQSTSGNAAGAGVVPTVGEFKF